jgi:hypothetical protein
MKKAQIGGLLLALVAVLSIVLVSTNLRDITGNAVPYNTNCTACILQGFKYDVDGGSCAGASNFTFESGLTPNCCGDDSGEYFSLLSIDPGLVVPVPITPTESCCAEEGSCVYGTSCVSNLTHLNYGGDNATDVCIDGTWYDCYDNSDCVSGYFCNSSNDCQFDNWPPNVNLNMSSTNSNTAVNEWKFFVSDLTGVNITRTRIDVPTASPQSLNYYYDNMSCTELDGIRSYYCTITVTLGTYYYFPKIYAWDIHGMQNDLIFGYHVDLRTDFVAGVDDQGDITTSRKLYANWSEVPYYEGKTPLMFYQYALGTAKYPNPGWDSVLSWTNVSTNTSVNRTFGISPGFAYYFNVRGKNSAGSYSDVVSSDGILFNDISAPLCAGVFDDGLYAGNFTASNGYLHATWNFSDTESDIVEYLYAVGDVSQTIGQPPVPGYNTIKPATSTSLNDVTAYNLNLQNGKSYYFSVRARNSGNQWSSWCYSDGIIVDVVKPQNGSLDYTNGIVDNNKITVVLNKGQDSLSGIQTDQLYVSASPVDLHSNRCNSFISYVPVASSPYPSSFIYNATNGYCYKFRYKVADRAGNTVYYYSQSESQSPINYTLIDTTKPGMFSVFDEGFNTYDQYELFANWTYSADNESGIQFYRWSLWQYPPGGPMSPYYNWTWGTVAGTQNSVLVKNLNLVDGTKYYFKIEAVNYANLTRNVTSDGIIFIDKSGPRTTLVSVNGKVSPPFTDNTNDGSTLVIVHGEPYMRCIWSETDTGYYATGSNNCTTTGANASCSINSAQGDKTFYIFCKDQSGNEQNMGAGLEVHVNIDWPEAPIVDSVIFNPANPGTDDQLVCSAVYHENDAGDAVAFVSWEWDENLSLIPDQSTPILDLTIPGLNRGDYIKCGVSVTDTTARSSGWVYYGSYINNSAPYPFLIFEGPGFISQNNDFDWSDTVDPDGDSLFYTFQVSDRSDFSRINYTINTVTSTYNLPVASLSDSRYYWRVIAFDNAPSPWNKWNNHTISSNHGTFYLDKTGPVISITNPSPAETLGAVITFRANINDANANISKAWFSITGPASDSGIMQKGTTDYSAHWSNPSFPDGNYTLYIYANDSLGNSAGSSVSFELDNGVPSIDFMNPNINNRYFNGNSFSLSLICQNFNNASYKIWDSAHNIIQQNSIVSMSGSTYYEFTDYVNLSKYTDGTYTIELNARDAVNSASKTFDFYVDHTAPVYNTVSRTADPIFNDMNVVLTAEWPNNYNMFANMLDLSTVYIRHNATGSWENYTASENNGVFTLMIPSSMLYNQQRVAWNSYAEDQAGNWNKTMPVMSFTVQNRAPELFDLIRDRNWMINNNLSINLNNHFTDPDSDSLLFSTWILPSGTLLYDSFDLEKTTEQIATEYTNLNIGGGAVLAERDALNLISQPSFESTSSWHSFGTPSVTPDSYDGTKALTVNVNNYYYQDVPVSALQDYTLSMYMKGSGQGQMHVEWYNGAVHISSSLSCPICSFTLTPGYTKYQQTLKSPASATIARIYVDTRSVNYATVDAVQFESGVYATSFANPIRAGSKLYYDILDISEGTIEFWFSPEWQADSDSRDHMFLMTNNFMLTESNSQLKLKDISYNINWLKGNYNHVAVAFDSTNMKLYLNGVLVAATTNSITTPVDFIYLGSDNNAQNQVDSYIDEFAVFNYKKTNTEILADASTFDLKTKASITAQLSGNMLTLSPDYNWIGKNVLWVFAQDPYSEYKISDRVQLDVAPLHINHAPTINVPDANAYVGVNFVYDLSEYAYDSDDDILTYSENATQFTINPSTGIISWTPTAEDTGDINVRATVCDAYNCTSDSFNILVRGDSDSDGIPDSVDTLIGNAGSINSTLNLSMAVNNQNNLSQIFSGILPVKIYLNGKLLVEFSWDFSSTLYLDEITIITQTSGPKGFTEIHDLDLGEGTKTVYVSQLSSSQNAVCVIDTDFASVSAVSVNCTDTDETLVRCNGNVYSGFTCTDAGDFLRVTGLHHSVAQTLNVKTTSGGGGGGGGGGSSSSSMCTPNWNCTQWSVCGLNALKTRECTDTKKCITQIGKPNLTLQCAPEELCANGLKDETEEGIDCGVVCAVQCSVIEITTTTYARTPVIVQKPQQNEGGIPSLWIWALFALVMVTGCGAAAAFYYETRKSHSRTGFEMRPVPITELEEPELHQETSLITPVTETLNPAEAEIEELLKRANSVVFVNLNEASEIYTKIGREYKRLPSAVKEKYYEKTMLLYNKMLLELKRGQAEKEIKQKHVQSAEKIVADVENLYREIMDKSPQRTVEKLSAGSRKSYELTLNRLHQLISEAKTELAENNISEAKKKCEIIIKLFNSLPIEIRSKLKFEIKKLYDTLKNS